MKSFEPTHTSPPEVIQPAIRRAVLGRAVAVAAVACAGAGLGYGLQHSLPAQPWSGAVIGGVVAALVGPALVAMGWLPSGWAALRALRWRRTWRSRAVAAPATLPPPDASRAVRDVLTGAYTQQHFVAATDREWSRIRRHGEDAALLMIDIDHFKALNDRSGLRCGDAMLVEATRQVAATLRQYDLLARFGGGVLVVYLPHTDPLGALDVAERIRERVSAIRLTWNGDTVRTSISVGVAGIGASHGTLDDAIGDAGAALRDAKAAGRNCVRAAPIPPRREPGLGAPVGDRRRAGPV